MQTEKAAKHKIVAIRDLIIQPDAFVTMQTEKAA